MGNTRADVGVYDSADGVDVGGELGGAVGGEAGAQDRVEERGVDGCEDGAGDAAQWGWGEDAREEGQRGAEVGQQGVEGGGRAEGVACRGRCGEGGPRVAGGEK